MDGQDRRGSTAMKTELHTRWRAWQMLHASLCKPDGLQQLRHTNIAELLVRNAR